MQVFEVACWLDLQVARSRGDYLDGDGVRFENIIATISMVGLLFKLSLFRFCLGVHKGMKWKGMYLSKGKEWKVWNGMKLSNLDWMF